MSYVVMFRGSDDVRDYHRAGKKAKHGISMVMEGLEKSDKDMILEGAEKAWHGVKTMCEISNEMEEQYGERRFNDNFHDRDEWGQRHDRDGFNYRHDGDWNERDDEWMERKMRDSRGRYARR